jgi:hypothetical protein
MKLIKQYVKKICSLNPTKYEYIEINKALQQYCNWLDYIFNESPYYKRGDYVKTFKEWLEYEI